MELYIGLHYDMVAFGSGFRSLLMSFSIADEVFGEIIMSEL